MLKLREACEIILPKCVHILSETETWSQGFKTFSMLKSAKHEIYPAHNIYKHDEYNISTRLLKHDTSSFVCILVL